MFDTCDLFLFFSLGKNDGSIKFNNAIIDHFVINGKVARDFFLLLNVQRVCMCLCVCIGYVNVYVEFSVR